MSWSRLWETRLVPQLAHGVLTHHSGISLNHSCTYLNLKPVAGKWASLMAQMVKNLPATQETWVQSLGGEDPFEKEMTTHFSTLLGEFHEQRSLVGYTP